MLLLPHICQHFCELQPSRSKLRHPVRQLTRPLKASAYFSTLTLSHTTSSWILLDHMFTCRRRKSLFQSKSIQIKSVVERFVLIRCWPVKLMDAHGCSSCHTWEFLFTHYHYSASGNPWFVGGIGTSPVSGYCAVAIVQNPPPTQRKLWATYVSKLKLMFADALWDSVSQEATGKLILLAIFFSIETIGWRSAEPSAPE